MGLVSVFAIMLTPPICFYFKYPAKLWFTKNYASIAVLNTILVLYSVDCTLNNQFNPVFILISGAVSGWLISGVQPNQKSVKIVRILKKKSVIINDS